MMMYSLVYNLVVSASSALNERIEEVNRLNVFPVPDGDTGTNMTLTLQAVVNELAKLNDSATLADICAAATHGSLMGARGNSGVITSQIIRGACEGILASEGKSLTERLAITLETATTVAFQAVRKPVEGTILTVIRDMATAARSAKNENLDFEDALQAVSVASYASVRRTPDLLPVLKSAGVVDAGGFGLAIFFDGFVSAFLGKEFIAPPVPDGADSSVAVALVDDWDDNEYLYCTEFLLFGEGINKEALHDFVAEKGGSELVVGDHGEYKIHVHTDDPGQVLAHALSLGEIADVHIHNMRRQQAERPSSNPGSSHATGEDQAERKPVGIVAVASGSGLAEIFKSIGVDVVVSGGQTMNPSTQDLIDAAAKVSADKIIFLPNNSNIIMAAQAAASVLDVPAGVVNSRSVPAGFAAMFAFDDSLELDEIISDMSDAMAAVHTAEITTAIKDATSDVGDITAGQVIGIVNGKEIEAIGESIEEVTLELLQNMVDDESETVTLILGEDMSDEDGAALQATIEKKHDSVSVEVHRGEQPLYPLILSVE